MAEDEYWGRCSGLEFTNRSQIRTSPRPLRESPVRHEMTRSPCLKKSLPFSWRSRTKGLGLTPAPAVSYGVEMLSGGNERWPSNQNTMTCSSKEG